MGHALPRIVRAIKKVTGATAVNILQNNGAEAGQAVDHVHFHIIPKYADRNSGGGLKMEFEPHLPETSCTVRMSWQTN